jgi:hypothetical protein
MPPTTAILKRLSVGEFHDYEAPVLLDGQPVGKLVREGRYTYCEVRGESAGAGLNLQTALKSFAVHLWLQDQRQAVTA